MLLNNIYQAHALKIAVQQIIQGDILKVNPHKYLNVKIWLKFPIGKNRPHQKYKVDCSEAKRDLNVNEQDQDALNNHEKITHWMVNDLIQLDIFNMTLFRNLLVSFVTILYHQDNSFSNVPNSTRTWFVSMNCSHQSIHIC